ncbi:type II toxin-antitoxin system RelE/ParE family toxin [Prosthecomicrobium sp. N25]|uniref:type II toxin-antitoxin system RelE/ParE family toxin n=1 Tax=Prosthecomicrobium sp. N25 TaxID=3129254 RepID=UPI003077B7B6
MARTTADVRPVAFRTAARRDLRDIARYIARESGSRATAEAFVGRLIGHCFRLARLEATAGRIRADIGPEYRSTPFGRYVIIFRYDGSTFLVVAILSAYRDLRPVVVRRNDRDPE